MTIENKYFELDEIEKGFIKAKKRVFMTGLIGAIILFLNSFILLVLAFKFSFENGVFHFNPGSLIMVFGFILSFIGAILLFKNLPEQ